MFTTKIEKICKYYTVGVFFSLIYQKVKTSHQFLRKNIIQDSKKKFMKILRFLRPVKFG